MPSRSESEQLSEDMRSAIASIADVMVSSGMPRMPARVFAALLTSRDAEMTAAQIGERLQASPAAVSGAVRYLEQVGLIRRSRHPGSRRDHFVLGEDVWYEVFASRDSVLRAWEQAMLTAATSLGRRTKAGRRLAESAEFFAFIGREIPDLVRRWHVERVRMRLAAGDELLGGGETPAEWSP